MYRGELLFFLLAVGIFSIDFFKVGTGLFFDSNTLPPKITQWKLDSCTRTISVQQVTGGIPPYDFYVFKQDPLDLSSWQVYRLIKEQLPQISSLPPGTYRFKAVNEGVISASFATNILEVSFPEDPVIEVKGTTSLCSGSSTAIAFHLAQSDVSLPIRWTARVLLAPEGGGLLGYTSNPITPLLEIRDTLINTGKTLAKVSYQLQALVNGCLLPARTLEVQVDPVPRIEASVSDSLLCSGTPFSISLLPKSWGASPMQLRWSAEVLAGQVAGLVQGEQSPLAALTPITQTLANRGTAPARVRYTFYPSFQGCEGITEIVEVLVLPEPQVTPQADLISCAGEWVSVPEFTSNFPGDSITYSWEVSDSSIGLSSGRGHQIPAFQAINSSSSSLKQALIRVTPMLYSQGISCTGSPFSFSITVRPPLVLKEELSNYAGFGVSCAGAADGKIKLELSGGILPGEEPSYRYSWTGPEGFVSIAANLEGLQAGLYRLQVSTGMGNCLLEKSMLLSQPEMLQISQSQVNNLCYQGNVGSISIRVSGGMTPYSYTWTGSNGFTATTDNLQDLASGTYQVRVKDANGCTITGAAQTITEPSPLTLNQVKVDNSCFQGGVGNITVTASGGTGPYTYAWTGPNGFTATTDNLQNLASGTYQVRVRDANGCMITGAAQTITEPTPLALTQTKVNNVCAQRASGSFTISASGGKAPYTYAWTGPNNFSSTVANPQNLRSGNYQVTVTDANNCFVTGATQTITEPAALTITNQVKVDNVCAQGAAGSITVTAAGGTGPYSYAWTGPNNFSSTVANPQNLRSGTYQVRVIDANGCTITGATQTITEPTALTITSQVKVDNVCAQGATGTITVTAAGGTGPYSYAWTGLNNFSSTVANPQNLVAGTYQATVTDANGCTVTGAVQTITEPTPLALTQTKVDNVCAQRASGSFTISASGGKGPYIYAWTGPNNFSSTVANPQNLVAGTYQATVTDANGCTITGAVQTITEPTPLALNQVKVDNSCFQGGIGNITVTASGGTIPYRYAWTGPNEFIATTKDLQNLASGSYQVRVTDANGCTITGFPQTITEPAALTLTQVKVDNRCAQGASGSITVTASGGTGPYTYAWTGPNGFTATTENLQNLASGSYQVRVRDANGCTITGAVQTITEPTQIAISAQVQAETCADAKDGRIELTLSGGLPPYQYRWDHGPTGPVVTGLGAGTYRVTLTDQNGCTQTAEYSLLPIPALRLDGTVTYQAIQAPVQISALLQSDAQGGTPPYTYRWNTGQTTPSITVTESGTFTLQLKDATGCVQEKEFVVNLPLPLAIDVEVNTIPLCEEEGQESTLRLSIQDGLPPYQITWSRGTASQGGLVLITRESGLFEVEVRDALGLVEKRSITIRPRLTGPLDFEQRFESQAQFQADLVGFKGVFRPIATWPHQVISWNFGDGTSSSEPNPSHTYTSKGRYTLTLTVLDESGCLITNSKVIDVLDYFIEIPNVFTPNGDQLNDTFFPKFSFIPSLQLQVMNTWGELIYRSHGLEDAGWDGTVAGQKAPEGVYVYKLTYQVPDGRNFTSSSTFLLAR